MQIIQIQQLKEKVCIDAVALPAATPRQLNLFSVNSFERVSHLRLLDGSEWAIPNMPKSDRALASQLFDSVPPTKRNALQNAFAKMALALQHAAKYNLSANELTSDSEALVNQAQETLELYIAVSGNRQGDQAVQALLFGSIVNLEQDLATFATNIHNKNQIANEIRTDITELREALSDWPEGMDTQEFSWTEVVVDENGNVTLVNHENVALSKEEAEALLNKLEEQLTGLKDMTEMERFELQKMTTDYQQALSTLSGLLKSQHDSLMTIIRNARG